MVHIANQFGTFSVQHGDTVRFRAADGSERNGKANGLLFFESHLVLDMGGKHGTPRVVQFADVVRVIRKA